MSTNSIFIGSLRDTRQILIRGGISKAVLTVDPVTLAALAIPLPTLAAIAVMPSGLIVIGPEQTIRACRDPISIT